MSRPAAVRSLVLLAAAGALLAACWILPVRELLARFTERVKDWGAWGPVAVGAIYLPVCVLFLPASVITLGAGYALGLVRGTIAVSVGSTLGVAATYWLGRTLAREWVEERVARSRNFRAIDEAVGREGFKIVFLTRLSPAIPFNLLNFFYGVTRVRFRDYILASWIGMLPGTILYVYLGSAGKSLAEGGEKTAAQKAVLYGGLLATVLVTIVVTRLARNALANVESRKSEVGGGK